MANCGLPVESSFRSRTLLLYDVAVLTDTNPPRMKPPSDVSAKVSA